MPKIIETNLSVNDVDVMIDHQSRVIDVPSWDDYVNGIEEARSVKYDGTMLGYTLPREARIQNLKHDDYHLSCDVHTATGNKSKKLAYLIKGGEKVES